MSARNADPGNDTADIQTLQRQVRSLQERLSFYEGFDGLIQENVAQSRELLRLAAKEREAATGAAETARLERESRETERRAELLAMREDIGAISRSLSDLGRRVDAALGLVASAPTASPVAAAPRAIAVIVHGVPSARTALSLQRYLSSLRQVSDVQTREFAGGVLRLEVQADDLITGAQFANWEDPRYVETLTERPDTIELMLRPAIVSQIGA